MYTSQQKRDIAHELARADSVVEKAVAALKQEYETFDGIGATTVRRLLRDKKFQALLRKEQMAVAAARDKNHRAAVEKKAEDESLGRSDIKRMLIDGAKKAHEAVGKGDLSAIRSMVECIKTLRQLDPKADSSEFSPDTE